MIENYVDGEEIDSESTQSMSKEWKFEPDPITRGYIKYLDESPITFDNLNRQIYN